VAGTHVMWGPATGLIPPGAIVPNSGADLPFAHVF